MDTTKTIGWGTFLMGIFIILFTINFTYNIFTGKEKAPEIFDFEIVKTEPETLNDGLPSQSQMVEMMMRELKELLPAESISKTLDLVVWTMGAGILILGGNQVASLGIKLIKK